MRPITIIQQVNIHHGNIETTVVNNYFIDQSPPIMVQETKTIDRLQGFIIILLKIICFVLGLIFIYLVIDNKTVAITALGSIIGFYSDLVTIINSLAQFQGKILTGGP